MNITREADYAIRVIAHLSNAASGEIISASTISDVQSIPSQFLLKILRKLRKAELIKSHMGVNGGYELNKNPENISLKDVIEAIDGPIYLNRCLYHPDDCNRKASAVCPIRSQLSVIEGALLRNLDSVNFANLEGNY